VYLAGCAIFLASCVEAMFVAKTMEGAEPFVPLYDYI
jgi:hypothetical protein